jgi:lysyl-tRNA synthetase class II
MHDLTHEERETLKSLVEEAKNLTQQETSGALEWKVRSAGTIWNPQLRKLKRRRERVNTELRTTTQQEGRQEAQTQVKSTTLPLRQNTNNVERTN